MKKRKRILSAILGVIIAANMFPLGASAASGSLKSDTTAPFSVGMGKNYTFKITANGTSQKPVVTVANGSALKVTYRGQQGNNYFYMVTAIGQEGSTSGVYMALPGQGAVRCCIVTVGIPQSQTTNQTIYLNDLNYVTEKQTVDNDGNNLYFKDIIGNEYDGWDTSNADITYNKGLLLLWQGDGRDYYLDYDGGVYREYLLNGAYGKLTGTFALTQKERNVTTNEITLKVFGDGKELYESDPATAGVLPQDVNIDISGVKLLNVEMDLNGNIDGTYPTAGFYNVQLRK